MWSSVTAGLVDRLVPDGEKDCSAKRDIAASAKEEATRGKARVFGRRATQDPEACIHNRQLTQDRLN